MQKCSDAQSATTPLGRAPALGPDHGVEMAPETSPVRVVLAHEGQEWVVQPGRLGQGGWLS